MYITDSQWYSSKMDFELEKQIVCSGTGVARSAPDLKYLIANVKLNYNRIH